MKADVETKKTTRWTEPNCFPSEPVFVEAPDAVDEDDGEYYRNTYSTWSFIVTILGFFSLKIVYFKISKIAKQNIICLYLL